MIEMRDAGSLRIFPAKVPPHNASYNNGTVLFIPALPGLFVGGSRKMILTAPETEGLMTPPEGGFNWGGGANASPRTAKQRGRVDCFKRSRIVYRRCAIAYMNELTWFSIYKEAYDTPELKSFKLDYLGGQDIVDFFVKPSSDH